MRVLQLNYGDLGPGGASIAAYRLHRSLMTAGVDSHMRVAVKTSDDPTVSVARGYGRVRKPLQSALHSLGLNELDGVSPYVLLRDPQFEAADVVHCHALQGSWFSYPALRLMARTKPVVMTLHDMWPFTGHCSFSFGCDRWQSGCGSCPHLDTYPAVRRDATRFEWRLKRRIWSGVTPTVVCPSHWMAELAGDSILGDGPIHVIPHGLDLDVYRSSAREAGRTSLGIGGETTAILFAASSVDDPRKGASTLISVAEALVDDRDSVRFILLGGGDGSLARALRARGFEVDEMGFIVDEQQKSGVYSTADLLVFPTKADNSPLVVLESVSCGTPTLSFDLGGIRDLVIDGTTGVLVREGDVAAMAASLRQLVRAPKRLAAMRQPCRDLALRNHRLDVAAERHVQVYEAALRRHGSVVA